VLHWNLRQLCKRELSKHSQDPQASKQHGWCASSSGSTNSLTSKCYPGVYLLCRVSFAPMYCFTSSTICRLNWCNYLCSSLALFIWLIIRLIQLVFSAGTVFFSHKKSANSVFQPAYNSSRMAPLLLIIKLFLVKNTHTQRLILPIHACYERDLEARPIFPSKESITYASPKTVTLQWKI
jgi:hypothetical protein